MKTLKKVGWVIGYVFILFMFYVCATIAFIAGELTGFWTLAWAMVLGGAYAIGGVGYEMIKELFIEKNEQA